MYLKKYLGVKIQRNTCLHIPKKSRAVYGQIFSQRIAIFEIKKMKKLNEKPPLEKEETKILIEKEKEEVRFKIVEHMACFK